MSLLDRAALASSPLRCRARSAGRRYRFRVTTFALIGGGWRARMFLKGHVSWARSAAEGWWC
jgi:hypothetical protein